MSRPSSITYKQLLEVMGSVNPGPSPRGLRTKEAIGYQTRVDMRYPIVNIKERGLDYSFMAAEAYWILTGNARLDNPIVRKNLEKYSDTDITMAGAYGPMFIEQYRYVVDKLREDPETRQAVMTFWRPNPRSSKDVPCTVSMQFLIREGRIHTLVGMRSSDAWLGWPYDIFSFTMITIYIALCLKRDHLELGHLTLTAGSQHLYERHWDKADELLQHKDNGDIPIISLYDFIRPDHLLNCLNYVVNDRLSMDDHITTHIPEAFTKLCRLAHP